MLYQMDIKSVFLNGLIKEEVDVEQPLGFESSIYPYHVFKFNKALYILKIAPWALYEKLSSFLIENGFIRGKVDTTLFHKDYGSQFLIIQIYVDDIIFDATNDSLCEDFFQAYAGRVWDEYDGRIDVFLGL